MDKVIYKESEIQKQILDAIDFTVNPVASTLGPKGTNVMFETDRGDHAMTNDGITILRNLSSSDKVTQAVIEIIKGAAMRTNTEGGDGTTTTTTLSGVLSKEAIKLLETYSWIQIRDALNDIKDSILKRIEKMRIKPDGKKGLLEIATISSNNDTKIAEDVIKAINVAKEDGMIFLEPNNAPTTELTEDLGFMVKSGVLYQELFTDSGKSTVVLRNTPVLLTDKKLYYEEEAETILRAAIKAGHKSIVIVARDFMGQAVNTFIANHSKGVIQVMLVKMDSVDEKNNETLQDLAVYIGAKIITEKTGSLVNKLTAEDLTIVNQAFSDPSKTLFTPKVAGSKKLRERISLIKSELEKDKDNEKIKARLASLTTGVVTIKVGGHTPIETREKLYRYEDAIHATRSAMKHGYLPGGGTSILRAYNPNDCANKDFLPLYRKFSEAIIRQIAANAGEHEDTIVKTTLEGKGNYGYNARTGKFEDLLKAGVIDPYMVVKLAVENSISVATTLVSIKYYMLNEKKDEEDN